MMYDLAIIGGGPAGYSAAFEAVKHRLRVVLFEKDSIGGTCLNRGCVPTKYLGHVSRLYKDITESGRFGICPGKVSIDYGGTMARCGEVIAELRNGLSERLSDSGVKVVNGRASLLDGLTVSCNGILYEAGHVLIATGSSKSRLFSETGISTDELLKRTELPKSIKIIGGGVTAVEFATVFSQFGIPVTICIRGKHILRNWDRDIRIGVTQNLRRHSVQIRTQCLDDGFKEADSDVVLIATGREHSIEGISGRYVDIGGHGGIIADAVGRTKTEGLYAAGDVVESSPMLAHVAMEQGRRVVNDIVGRSQNIDYAVTSCIYTEPEAASVGMTEQDAAHQSVETKVIKQALYSNARTLISTQDRCFIKLIASAENHVLLGAHIMCERATDIASEISLAISRKMTVNDLVANIRPHPSYSEAITDTVNSFLAKYS